MVFTADNTRVIRVGAGAGVILPKGNMKRYDIEVGDKVRIEITYIYRGDRRNYQQRRNYKVGADGKLYKTK